MSGWDLGFRSWFWRVLGRMGSLYARDPGARERAGRGIVMPSLSDSAPYPEFRRVSTLEARKRRLQWKSIAPFILELDLWHVKPVKAGSRPGPCPQATPSFPPRLPPSS